MTEVKMQGERGAELPPLSDKGGRSQKKVGDDEIDEGEWSLDAFFLERKKLQLRELVKYMSSIADLDNPNRLEQAKPLASMLFKRWDALILQLSEDETRDALSAAHRREPEHRHIGLANLLSKLSDRGILIFAREALSVEEFSKVYVPANGFSEAYMKSFFRPKPSPRARGVQDSRRGKVGTTVHMEQELHTAAKILAAKTRLPVQSIFKALMQCAVELSNESPSFVQRLSALSDDPRGATDAAIAAVIGSFLKISR